MITHRRIYQGTPGKASNIVALIKQYQEFVSKLTPHPPYRIYTDMISGHTDRVVLETDVESLAHLEQVQQVTSQHPRYKNFYSK